jgi:hypothetical protein
LNDAIEELEIAAFDCGKRHDAGTMNDGIDSAQLRLGLGEHGLHLGRICYVGLYRDGVPILRRDLRDHLIGPGGTARIVHGHGEAIGCQAQRDRAANAAGCARHQRDAICSLAHFPLQQ